MLNGGLYWGTDGGISQAGGGASHKEGISELCCSPPWCMLKTKGPLTEHRSQRPKGKAWTQRITHTSWLSLTKLQYVAGHVCLETQHAPCRPITLLFWLETLTVYLRKPWMRYNEASFFFLKARWHSGEMGSTYADIGHFWAQLNKKCHTYY